MTAFLVGLAAGLVMGFVMGALWAVLQELRLQKKLRAWGVQRELRRLQDNDDE